MARKTYRIAYNKDKIAILEQINAYKAEIKNLRFKIEDLKAKLYKLNTDHMTAAQTRTHLTAKDKIPLAEEQVSTEKFVESMENRNTW